ncbi:MAG: hypothetical protein QG555_95 [Thermodesulfobacteriota bacterium]|nr:hypothetical protein [Thermodesulfobacteriota bacterium]
MCFVLWMLFCVITWGTWFCGTVDAADLVVGVAPQWVRDVKKDRNPGETHDGSEPYKPFYFWMAYEGNEAALKYIKKRGSLPIWHRWSVWIGGYGMVEQPDHVYVEKESLPLSVGNDSGRIYAALKGRVKSGKNFSWRTWSMKESISRGQWRVEVLYDDGSPVNCRIDGMLQRCSYIISVK